MTKELFDSVLETIVERYKDGEMITHTELKTLMHYKEPVFSGDIDEYKEALQNAQFVWLSLVERLKDELLEKYSIALKNIRGEGYQLLPPKEQTSYAADNCIKDIRKSISWAERVITNVRYEKLSDAERVENNNAKAKLTQMRQMFDARRKASLV